MYRFVHCVCLLQEFAVNPCTHHQLHWLYIYLCHVFAVLAARPIASYLSQTKFITVFLFVCVLCSYLYHHLSGCQLYCCCLHLLSFLGPS